MLSLAIGTTWAQFDDYNSGEEEAPKKWAPEPASEPAPVVKKAAVKSSESSSEDGFKLGFYGTIAGTPGIAISAGEIGKLASEDLGVDGPPVQLGISYLGLLFNLGGGIEIGLGLGLSRLSVAIESQSVGAPTLKQDVSVMLYELIPSVSYQLGKIDFISYGAGLDAHLSTWSYTHPKDDGTTGTQTDEPNSMDMGFFPNFYIKAEIIKNFQIGLKTGLFMIMPGDAIWEIPGALKITASTMLISTKTEVGVSFYL